MQKLAIVTFVFGHQQSIAAISFTIETQND